MKPYTGKLTKSVLEKAAKYGKPAYSITRRFIKGWEMDGTYYPNPHFTVDNVLKARLLVFETINILLKKGFSVVMERSGLYGNMATLMLKRGNQEMPFKLTSDEYQEITKHLNKTTFATS